MRHLFKSLFMTLVVTVGAVIALVVLLNHSFFDAWVNTITFWCIIVLLACIWGAFVGEVKETLGPQKKAGPAEDAVEKLVDAAALSEAEEEAADTPFAEAEAPEAEPAPAQPEEQPAGNAPLPRVILRRPTKPSVYEPNTTTHLLLSPLLRRRLHRHKPSPGTNHAHARRMCGESLREQCPHEECRQ